MHKSPTPCLHMRNKRDRVYGQNRAYCYIYWYQQIFIYLFFLCICVDFSLCASIYICYLSKLIIGTSIHINYLGGRGLSDLFHGGRNKDFFIVLFCSPFSCFLKYGILYPMSKRKADGPSAISGLQYYTRKIYVSSFTRRKTLTNYWHQ